VRVVLLNSNAGQGEEVRSVLAGATAGLPGASRRALDHRDLRVCRGSRELYVAISPALHILPFILLSSHLDRLLSNCTADGSLLF
jgi:hypothetical protein